jgi:hypothetical protein
MRSNPCVSNNSHFLNKYTLNLNITTTRIMALQSPSQPPTPPFSPTLWYRIRNTRVNPSTHCLDVINDSEGNTTLCSGLLKIATIGNYAGQYWQFAPIPIPTSSTTTDSNKDGEKYILRTWWLGPNRRLTISSGHDSAPILLPGERQVWSIGDWGDSTLWLSSLVDGKEKVLDVGEDGETLTMHEKDESRLTQRWTVEVFQHITEQGFHAGNGLTNTEVFIMSDAWTRS